MGPLGWTACGLGVLLTSACTKPLSESECEALLIHYTDRLLVADRSDTSTEERARMKVEVRQLAARDPAFQRCSESVSRTAYHCSMAAGSVDEVERCLL